MLEFPHTVSDLSFIFKTALIPSIRLSKLLLQIFTFFLPLSYNIIKVMLQLNFFFWNLVR